ncbi:hypothetical protein EC988_004631, partial [Linderina pennispora]
PAIAALSGDKCPEDTLSCSANIKDADTCCYEVNGIFALVDFWIKGVGPEDKFSLNGLYPHTCDNTLTGADGCDPSRKVNNVESIISTVNKTLYKDMRTYWSSDGDNEPLWLHIWNVHATCMSTNRPECFSNFSRYQDMVAYFSSALALYKRYNFYAALAKHDIVPDNTKAVDPAKFKNAIKAELGVDAAIRCLHNELVEIR